MLETVARSFDVDIATSKATCIDLMRANPFDVVVASERLSDGSGLELLSHISTRWPETMRVLVIEPQRLKLLKGKLGPFRLHATLRYPLDEDELETVLERLQRYVETEEEEGDEEEEHAPPEPAPVAVQVATPVRIETLKVQKIQLPQAATPKSSRTLNGTRPGNTASRQIPGAPVRPPAPGPTIRTPGPSPTRSAPVAAAPRPTPISPPRPVAPNRGTQTGSSPVARALAARPGKPGHPPGRTTRSNGAPQALKPGPPPLVKRRLGNYTPLGAVEDDHVRIVGREFDQTIAPLAARAIRAREAGVRAQSPAARIASMALNLRNTLRRLMKR